MRIGARRVEVLDLDHEAVENRIIPDIERGTKVYYDRRWRASESFASFLEREPRHVRGATVLVLGCGVGLEALAAAPYAKALILNDLSATAVELSRAQLDRNGFRAHDPLVGRWEQVALPRFDVAIGSFLVYDDASRRALADFMDRTDAPVLLANDPMEAFEDLLHDAGRTIRRLSSPDERPIVWFERGGGPVRPTAFRS